MQSGLSFLVDCQCQIVKFPNPKISKINGELYIWDQNLNFDYNEDAFNHPELIPELIKLVKKAEQGGNKEKLAIEWVKKWGVLAREKISDDKQGQNFSCFWRAAKDFETIWRVYKYTATRNIDVLKMGFKVIESIGELIRFSDDPVKNYQYNALEFIMKVIQRHTQNGFLQAYQIKNQEQLDLDVFKVTPAFSYHNLIDALYMQFLATLRENKKICPTCDTAFTPERKDKVYCSETCKLTAKSQRYRQRKEGLNA